MYVLLSSGMLKYHGAYPIISHAGATESLDFIFATEDGQFFLPHSEKHAKNHTVKARVKMLKIERPVKEATPKKRNKKTTKTNK